MLPGAWPGTKELLRRAVEARKVGVVTQKMRGAAASTLQNTAPRLPPQEQERLTYIFALRKTGRVIIKDVETPSLATVNGYNRTKRTCPSRRRCALPSARTARHRVLREKKQREYARFEPLPFLNDPGQPLGQPSSDVHGCECWSPADLRSPVRVI